MIWPRKEFHLHLEKRASWVKSLSLPLCVCVCIHRKTFAGTWSIFAWSREHPDVLRGLHTGWSGWGIKFRNGGDVKGRDGP